MGTLGAGEILVFALIALVVLGPDKLPDAARKVGQVIAELRKVSSGFQDELRDALHEPVDVPSTSIKRSPTPKATPAPPVADEATGPDTGEAIDPSGSMAGTDAPDPAPADVGHPDVSPTEVPSDPIRANGNVSRNGAVDPDGHAG